MLLKTFNEIYGQPTDPEPTPPVQYDFPTGVPHKRNVTEADIRDVGAKVGLAFRFSLLIPKYQALIDQTGLKYKLKTVVPFEGKTVTLRKPFSE